MKSRRSPERCASRALSAESNTSRLTESPWSTRPGYPISVWEPRRPEGIERNREILLAARVTGDRLHERRVLRFPGREEGADELRQRTELVPELLRQRLGEPRDLLAREPRHQPIAASGIDLVQREKRHGQRHAVALRARLVVVIEREAASGHLELVRKLHRGDPRRLMAHQSLPRSNAATRAGCFSQCGSYWWRLTRCAPTDSSHSGSMVATRRAYRRVVSVSSAAMIQRPAFLPTPEPG